MNWGKALIQAIACFRNLVTFAMFQGNEKREPLTYSVVDMIRPSSSEFSTEVVPWAEKILWGIQGEIWAISP